MKRNNPAWVKLFIEGGWERRASGAWFPRLVRTTKRGELQEVVWQGDKDQDNPYSLTHSGMVTSTGDLDEVLEAADCYAA